MILGINAVCKNTNKTTKTKKEKKTPHWGVISFPHKRTYKQRAARLPDWNYNANDDILDLESRANFLLLCIRIMFAPAS